MGVYVAGGLSFARPKIKGGGGGERARAGGKQQDKGRRRRERGRGGSKIVGTHTLISFSYDRPKMAAARPPSLALAYLSTTEADFAARVSFAS
jgi:hypothetical protein